MALDIFLLILFLVVIGIQLIYLTRFNLAFRNYEPPVLKNAGPVSILVCSQNQSKNLPKLLASLLVQEYATFEVIIVNDRSTDDSRELLEQESKKNDKLRVVNIDRLPDHVDGKKYALTLGIKAAQFDKIVLTDADCLPGSSHWLGHMASGFDDTTRIVLGYSGYEKQKGLLNYFIRFETLWTALQYISLAISGAPHMGVGRNLAYSKALVLQVKGFNGYQDVTGGDDDLFVNRNADKNNTKVVIGPGANTCSQPKRSWTAFYRQKLRHLSVGKHYSLGSKVILGLFSITHILGWVLFVLLLILGIEPIIVIASFLTRTLMLHLTLMMACKKLGEKFELWGLQILDCIFVLYYSLVGISALVTKKVKWI